jgi:hypothetical protein
MGLYFCDEIRFVAFWAILGRSNIRMEALNNHRRHRDISLEGFTLFTDHEGP